MANVVNLNINIESDVLTAETTAEVINAVLEFLLYQRNQIPFVYKTFKYYIQKWAEDEQRKSENESRGNNLYSKFDIERQRELAVQTKDSISDMKELINKLLKENEIKTLRFLFGPTILTPAESYTIHVPTPMISRKHLYENHRISQAHLNHSLLILLTTEELYSIFSKNLSLTNVFLEVEILDNHLSTSGVNSKAHVFPKDYCDLPSSCKDVNFHLVHTNPLCVIEEKDKGLQCCKELKIYSGLSNLSLLDCKVNMETKKEVENCPSLKPNWWEAEIKVRGFKEKTIKGSNIWAA